MPIGFYRLMSDDDLASIVRYLRAQPAVAQVASKSEYRIPLPTTYGPPVSGVKTPNPADALKYGDYLVNMAHCVNYHTPRDKK